MKRGQRKLIPAPGTPLHRHVFGAYHWHTGQVAWQQGEKKNSEAFIAFLEHLAFTVYPNQRLILVMDNASYHKSRATLAALAVLEERILVIWLPKYSPFLNPIERFWLHLKNLANANCLHPNLESLQAEIDTRMSNQNQPGHPDRLLFVDNLRSVA
jgi:putative transposase